MKNVSSVKQLPVPFSWYDLIFVGILFGGLVSWAMVGFRLFQHGYRRKGSLAFAMASILYICVTAMCRNWHDVWWIVSSSLIGLNLFMSIIAWRLQNRLLGPAPRRYRPEEWREWIHPLLVGLITGLCVALFFGLFKSMGNRAKLLTNSKDIVDHFSMLWDMFDGWHWGALLGTIWGAYWAGHWRSFRARTLVDYGLSIAIFTFSVTAIIFIQFFLNTGFTRSTADIISEFLAWLPYPPWIGGIEGVMISINQGLSEMAFWTVGLFFCHQRKLLDQVKYLFLIPSFIVLDLCFNQITGLAFSTSGSQLTEGGSIALAIVHEMSDPQSDNREKAFDKAELLLDRNPNMPRWPELAEMVARHRFQNGEIDRAKKIYRRIIERYPESSPPCWSDLVARTRLALQDPSENDEVVSLPIRVSDAASYLSANWMSLISMIKYWEGQGISDAQLKLRLMIISRNEDELSLPPMLTFADVTETARIFGYRTLILQANLDRLKNLLRARIPLLYRDDNRLLYINGFDDRRSCFTMHDFSKLSSYLRLQLSRRGGDILDQNGENNKKDRERMQRITLASYRELSYSEIIDANGPVAAIIDSSRAAHYLTTLGQEKEMVEQQGNAFRDSTVAEAFLDFGNPQRAVKWAMQARDHHDDDRPYLIAHLAELFHQGRNRSVRSSLGLENRYPVLATTIDWIHQPEIRHFLDEAARRFNLAANENRLPLDLLPRYIDLLDDTDPVQTEDLKKLLPEMLRRRPSYLEGWQRMSEIGEQTGDIKFLVAGLSGYSSFKPGDYPTKARLAYALVVSKEEERAGEILDQVEQSNLKHSADYWVAKAAIEEKKDPSNCPLIGSLYDKALSLRHSDAFIFYRSGKFLLGCGRSDETPWRLLEWARKIDGTGEIARTVDTLFERRRGTR